MTSIRRAERYYHDEDDEDNRDAPGGGGRNRESRDFLVIDGEEAGSEGGAGAVSRRSVGGGGTSRGGVGMGNVGMGSVGMGSGSSGSSVPVAYVRPTPAVRDVTKGEDHAELVRILFMETKAEMKSIVDHDRLLKREICSIRDEFDVLLKNFEQFEAASAVGCYDGYRPRSPENEDLNDNTEPWSINETSVWTTRAEELRRRRDRETSSRRQRWNSSQSRQGATTARRRSKEIESDSCVDSFNISAPTPTMNTIGSELLDDTDQPDTGIGLSTRSKDSVFRNGSKRCAAVEPFNATYVIHNEKSAASNHAPSDETLSNLSSIPRLPTDSINVTSMWSLDATGPLHSTMASCDSTDNLLGKPGASSNTHGKTDTISEIREYENKQQKYKPLRQSCNREPYNLPILPSIGERARPETKGSASGPVTPPKRPPSPRVGVYSRHLSVGQGLSDAAGNPAHPASTQRDLGERVKPVGVDDLISYGTPPNRSSSAPAFNPQRSLGSDIPVLTLTRDGSDITSNSSLSESDFGADESTPIVFRKYMQRSQQREQSGEGTFADSPASRRMSRERFLHMNEDGSRGSNDGTLTGSQEHQGATSSSTKDDDDEFGFDPADFNSDRPEFIIGGSQTEDGDSASESCNATRDSMADASLITTPPSSGIQSSDVTSSLPCSPMDNDHNDSSYKESDGALSGDVTSGDLESNKDIESVMFELKAKPAALRNQQCSQASSLDSAGGQDAPVNSPNSTAASGASAEWDQNALPKSNLLHPIVPKLGQPSARSSPHRARIHIERSMSVNRGQSAAAAGDFQDLDGQSAVLMHGAVAALNPRRRAKDRRSVPNIPNVNRLVCDDAPVADNRKDSDEDNFKENTRPSENGGESSRPPCVGKESTKTSSHRLSVPMDAMRPRSGSWSLASYDSRSPARRSIHGDVTGGFPLYPDHVSRGNTPLQRSHSLTLGSPSRAVTPGRDDGGGGEVQGALGLMPGPIKAISAQHVNKIDDLPEVDIYSKKTKKTTLLKRIQSLKKHLKTKSSKTKYDD